MHESSLAAAFQEPAPNGDFARPKHERLREYVAARVESGELKPGDALPSEYWFAETLQIARNTVRQAMASLERDGFVRRVHGKGTFIAEQAPRGSRTEQGLFALVVPQTQVGFYPALQRSFEQAAAELHMQVIVCNSNNEVDRQGNAILQLIENGASGVAIVPTTAPPTPSYQIRHLQRQGIPVVCCARRVAGVQAPLLAIPFEDVGRLAGEAVRGAGHQRVAYISHYRYEPSEAYERGFRAAFAPAKGNAPEVVTFYGTTPDPNMSAHEREIDSALDEMFGKGSDPTAIFASFDSLAELIYFLLTRRGLRVPQDVSLIGFGGSCREGVMMRRLTSVALDEVQMGRAAVELLHRMRIGELAIDYNETRMMPLGLSEGLTLGNCDKVTVCAQPQSPAFS